MSDQSLVPGRGSRALALRCDQWLEVARENYATMAAGQNPSRHVFSGHVNWDFHRRSARDQLIAETNNLCSWAPKRHPSFDPKRLWGFVEVVGEWSAGAQIADVAQRAKQLLDAAVEEVEKIKRAEEAAVIDLLAPVGISGPKRPEAIPEQPAATISPLSPEIEAKIRKLIEKLRLKKGARIPDLLEYLLENREATIETLKMKVHHDIETDRKTVIRYIRRASKELEGEEIQAWVSKTGQIIAIKEHAAP